MLGRGSDAGARPPDNGGTPLEVAEGSKGVLTEGAADPVTRRWQHKVELWKHPKVCCSAGWSQVSSTGSKVLQRKGDDL
jgi:hypothetical protein